MKDVLRRILAIQTRLKQHGMPAVVREPMILMSRFVSIGYGAMAVTGFAMLLPFLNEYGFSLPAILLLIALTISAQLGWEFQEIAKKLAAERNRKGD